MINPRAEQFKLKIYQEIIDRKAGSKIGQPIPWTVFATPSTFNRVYGIEGDVYAIAFDTNRIDASRVIGDKRLEHDIQTALKERTGNKNLQFRWVNSDGACAFIDERAKEFPALIPLPAAPASNYLIPFGQNKMGAARWLSLTDTGSIIVAGLTQHGKTTGFFSWLKALTQQHGPDELQLAIVDGKRFEFGSIFSHSPYLPDFMRGRVASDAREAEEVTRHLWAIIEARKRIFEQHKVYNLAGLAAKGIKLPLVVLFIDEYSVLRDDLFDDRLFMKILKQGVGLGVISIVGSQRIDAGTIEKTNFSTVLAYRLANVAESQVVFGNHDAYHTLKNGSQGELVVLGPGMNYEHLKGFYVDKDAPFEVDHAPGLPLFQRECHLAGLPAVPEPAPDEPDASQQPDPLEMHQLAYQVAHRRGIVHLRKQFGIGETKARRLQEESETFLTELDTLGFGVVEKN